MILEERRGGPHRGQYRVGRAGRVLGSVTPPGDKSISHRAVMLGSAARG